MGDVIQPPFGEPWGDMLRSLLRSPLLRKRSPDAQCSLWLLQLEPPVKCGFSVYLTNPSCKLTFVDFHFIEILPESEVTLARHPMFAAVVHFVHDVKSILQYVQTVSSTMPKYADAAVKVSLGPLVDVSGALSPPFVLWSSDEMSVLVEAASTSPESRCHAADSSSFILPLVQPFQSNKPPVPTTTTAVSTVTLTGTEDTDLQPAPVKRSALQRLNPAFPRNPVDNMRAARNRYEKVHAAYPTILDLGSVVTTGYNHSWAAKRQFGFIIDVEMPEDATREQERQQVSLCRHNAPLVVCDLPVMLQREIYWKEESYFIND